MLTVQDLARPGLFVVSWRLLELFSVALVSNRQKHEGIEQIPLLLSNWYTGRSHDIAGEWSAEVKKQLVAALLLPTLVLVASDWAASRMISCFSSELSSAPP